jgi:hypothetical protein
MWGTAASQRTEVQADGESEIRRCFSGLPISGGTLPLCGIPELTQGRRLRLTQLEIRIRNGAGERLLLLLLRVILHSTLIRLLRKAAVSRIGDRSGPKVGT